MNMCHTDVEVHELEYKWIISNFGLHLEHADDKKSSLTLKSSSFLAGDINNSKWHMELIINSGTDNAKDHIGLFTVLDDAETSTEILASQSYFFLTSNNAKNRIFRMRMHKFTGVSNRWGSNQVYRKRKLLKEATMYLVDDVLTIICQLHIMGKPIVASANCYVVKKTRFKDLSMDMGRLLTSEKFADVTFSLCNEKILAHKNILTARSPVFAAMFQHDMIERKENVVIIDDIEPEIFKQMLHYIYTNEVDCIESIAMDLLPPADKYELENLKSMCGEAIYKKITIENAAETLIFADRHSEAELIKCTQNFINTHIVEVMTTPGYRNLEKNHSQLAIMLYRRLAMKRPRKKVAKTEDECD